MQESLEMLLYDNNRTVFECLQFEACNLSCKSYKTELEDLLEIIDITLNNSKELEETLKTENETLKSTYTTSDLGFRISRSNEICNNEEFDKNRCDRIFQEYSASNEDPILPEAYANENFKLGTSENGRSATTAFLSSDKSVDEFLDLASFSSNLWIIYCCTDGKIACYRYFTFYSFRWNCRRNLLWWWKKLLKCLSKYCLCKVSTKENSNKFNMFSSYS